LIFLIIRFIIRLTTRKPASADAGSKALNVLAKWSLFFIFLCVRNHRCGLDLFLQINRFQVAFLGATSGPGFGLAADFLVPAWARPVLFLTRTGYTFS